ncbi:MAG: LD-carboxypeptidase [Betaproteobacteria bacterium]|nr:LD-carboxypeptidase [Betaproteobacteria bacterium]
MTAPLPRRLKPGATIGICAPSGFITEPGSLEIASLYLSERGYHIVEAPHVRNRWEYFAGTDYERLNDFHAMVRDPDIDVIMAARGGYGITRLLPAIDFQAVAASRKIIVGFSDVTALHLGLLAQQGMVTFAGPMACPDFGHHNRSPLHEAHFEGMLQAERHLSPAIKMPFTASDGEAGHLLRAQIGAGIEGTLWGGNLSLVAHLAGTPYLPHLEDGILFLEEVNEEPYKIERMLLQLAHAGILKKQRAILLGQFNRCEPTAASAAPYTFKSVVDFLKGWVHVPILQNLPFGHVRDKLTLPVGGHAHITLQDERHYRIELSGYNAAD